MPAIDSTDKLIDATINRQARLVLAQRRIKDLELALDVALAWRIKLEPIDSRAVSNEFVAMASIRADLTNDECRQILTEEMSRLAAEAKALSLPPELEVYFE